MRTCDAQKKRLLFVLEPAKHRAMLSGQSPPLNLISKLNQRVSLRHNISGLSSSYWSLKLEVIYER
jgi:hypothetical protein